MSYPSLNFALGETIDMLRDQVQSFVAKEIVDGWLAMAFTQKMEFKKDFLTNAFNQVKAIESENFK